MKLVLTICSIVFASFNVFASRPAAAVKPTCANEAVYAAVAKNYKTFEVSTSSCGIKALNLGSNLETYIVCTSDETEPMEYIVTVNPIKSSKDGTTSKKCVVEYVSASNESSTPTFESDKGLIKEAQKCSAEYGEAIVTCQ